MESKEALEDLKLTINALSTFLQRSSKKEYQDLKIIEKDLEILEILKKHIFYDKDEYDGIIDMEIIFQDNKDFIKIKEWINRE